MSSQYLFISVTDTYRRRHEMWQAQELEVTTLKRNFCFYIRKTGEQTQVPKKLVMRSSQKTSSSVQMLDQLFNAVFWCEQHRPSQLCQQQPPATGLPRFVFHRENQNCLGMTTCGTSRLFLAWFSSAPYCFSYCKNLCAGISPSIFLFKSLSFSSHS